MGEVVQFPGMIKCPELDMTEEEAMALELAEEEQLRPYAIRVSVEVPKVHFLDKMFQLLLGVAMGLIIGFTLFLPLAWN